MRVLLMSGFSFSVYSVTTTVSQVFWCSSVFVVDTSVHASCCLCNGDGWVIVVVKADGFRGGEMFFISQDHPSLC